MEFCRPSPRLWTARLIVWSAASAVTLPVAIVLSWLLAGPYVAAGVGLACGLLALSWLAMLHRRYRSWGYLEREDDLLIRRGVMVRRLSVVPYGRMQFLDVTAGPVDRWLGLATVQLHTAASATDAQIPGLTSKDAQELRDRLATLGEARAAGL